MQSEELHATLIDWSMADNLDTLANRVLENKRMPPLKFKDVADEVIKKLQKFGNENQDRFFSIDAPPLQKIKRLIPKHELDENPNLTDLRNTVKIIMDLIKQRSVFSTLPTDLTSLCEKYCDMEECLYLSISQCSISSPILATSINQASPLEITNFVNELKSRLSNNSPVFKMMIKKFFTHANFNTQCIFFKSLEVNDDHVLSQVIEALPKSLTYLVFSQCKCLTQEHVIQITKRLKDLRILSIKNCSFLLNDIIIENISKLSNLKSLGLKLSLPLDYKVFHKILTMHSLRSLHLNNNRFQDSIIPLKDPNSFVTNSLFVNELAKMKLRYLNLASCHLTPTNLSTLLKTTSIKNLNLNNNPALNDTLAQGIVQTESSIQTLHIKDCSSLTKNGILSLIRKLPNLECLIHGLKDPLEVEEIEKELQAKKNCMRHLKTSTKRKSEAS